MYLLLQKPLEVLTMDTKKDLGLMVLFFKIHIFYVYVFCLDVCISTMCVQCLQRSEDGIRSPAT